MTLEHPVVIETVEMEKSIYEFTKEGIVIISVKEKVHVELADSKAELEMVKTKTSYLPMRILVKPGKGATVSKEVREFVNLPDSMAVVKCQAILVDNLAHKIVATFMMKLYKQPNVFKVFSDEEEAIAWLREFN